MELLKKAWPFAFADKKDVAALVIHCVIMLVVGIVAGALIGILKGVPVLGWIIGIICSLIGLYVLADIVLAVLDYFKIIK